MAKSTQRQFEWPLAGRMLAYVRWYWVALAVFLSLVVGVSTQTFPYLQYLAIDRYLAPPAGTPWAAATLAARLEGTAAIAWRYLAVALVSFAAQVAFELTVAWMGQRVPGRRHLLPRPRIPPHRPRR